MLQSRTELACRGGRHLCTAYSQQPGPASLCHLLWPKCQDHCFPVAAAHLLLFCQPVIRKQCLPVQVEKLKAEAASQEAEVARLHSTTVHQLYVQDLDAFLEAYEAWEAEETANSGCHSTVFTTAAWSIRKGQILELEPCRLHVDRCLAACSLIALQA